MREFNLHERLIDFAVMIIEISKGIENSKPGNHLSGQIIRSGTAPSLNYSEAQSAESRNDFIHKMSIVLKELRETLSCLKILRKANLYLISNDMMEKTQIEANELISIFVRSIQTSKEKLKKDNTNNE
ncbi:four helix bundle protein [Flavobacterium sp. MAH-1]|uniref:Four helix bundle protein n=1 Tax=Flavobacterium agri TaxID=2743471 RepID=A0A7Y8Y1M9_9FLAO|nr:four helix bundle protein [Flavobacterium agri]NUY80173.1 four helix bundle protein [Flavobacterium agri]NYA70198.1 four helix bundle protein [Flavobacterium agri]